MKPQVKGFLSLLLTAVIFASFGVYVRYLNNQGLDVYQQVFLRGATGFGFAALASFLLKERFVFKKVSKLALAIYILSLPITIVSFVYSILLTKITTTIFGLYTASLITSLLIGYFFFKEKITRIKKIVLGLSFIGLLIYSYPLSLATINIGLLWALLNGVADSVVQSSAKFLSGKVDKFVLTSLRMLGLVVTVPLLALLVGGFSLPAMSTGSWVVGSWFGLMLVAVQFLTLVGFKNFDLNLGTIIISSELFFAGIFAYLFFREVPTLNELIGSLVIISAILLLNLNLDQAQISPKKSFWEKFLEVFRR